MKFKLHYFLLFLNISCIANCFLKATWKRQFKYLRFVYVLLVTISCKIPLDNLAPSGTSYQLEMRTLIENISKNAKAIKSDFFIIPQNGLELYQTENNLNLNYLKAIDGQLIEGRYFGNITVNQPVNGIDNTFFEKYLENKTKGDLPIFNIDYCDNVEIINKSLASNKAAGNKLFIAYNKNWTDLNSLQTPILEENTKNNKTLNETKNFFLLPKTNFTSKEIIFENLKNSNHDLLIIYPFYNNQLFTKTEIEALKTKKNGGKRLVIAFLNIGLADTKLFYWKPDWKIKLPSFTNKEIGNEEQFRVNYWETAWQNVLSGQENSLINNYIKSGFDGCYLSDVESFKYYE